MSIPFLQPCYPRLYMPDGHSDSFSAEAVMEYEFTHDAFEQFQVFVVKPNSNKLGFYSASRFLCSHSTTMAMRNQQEIESCVLTGTLSLHRYDTLFHRQFDGGTDLGYMKDDSVVSFPMRRILADSVDGLGIELAKVFSKCL